MYITYKIYFYLPFNHLHFENILSMIHHSFVYIFSLTVLFIVIFFAFYLSSQPKNKKRFNVQKAIFSLKEKLFLKISLLEHRPTPHLLSEYQKPHKKSGKQIVFASREIREKKKLFIEEKRNICLVYMSVCGGLLAGVRGVRKHPPSNV